MSKIIIQNALLINEGKQVKANLLIENQIIKTISANPINEDADQVYDIEGKYLFPGVIDDQVHFRDPGLTHKGDIFTESRAAAAGGVTSYMDMPNNNPAILTQELLADKYKMGAEKSMVNYSYYMGASNDNLEEVLKTDPKTVCGIKVFMGSSTGNMLVDDQETLAGIFGKAKLLIATHCEDEMTIRNNTQLAKDKYGDEIPFSEHPIIRSHEACYKSSSMAMELAKKHNTRLHILHLTTADEMELFDNTTPLKDKKITAEVCVHHLWFTAEDYDSYGSKIKWNPAVKNQADRDALREALKSGKIDVVATDHAPHTVEEKANSYLKAPSGGPLVQHSLITMLEMVNEGLWTPEFVAEKMCHNPAILYQVEKRGFIKEGYFADLVVVDPEANYTINKDNIAYKCGWSPLEGKTFSHAIEKTFVNGHLVFDQGKFDEEYRGMRMTFER
jgi:dihydroorotase